MMAGLGEANAASGITLCPWHWGAPQPLRGKFGYAPDLAIDINWPSTCEGEQVKMTMPRYVYSSTYDYESRFKITLSEKIHIIQTEIIHAGTRLFLTCLFLHALLLLAVSFRNHWLVTETMYMFLCRMLPPPFGGSAGRSSALGVMRSGWGWAFNCKEIMQSKFVQTMHCKQANMQTCRAA